MDRETIGGFMTFKKFDVGKTDYSLFDPILMEYYCKVSQMGNEKYGSDNLRKMTLNDK
jgi:hypothetical protein